MHASFVVFIHSTIHLQKTVYGLCLITGSLRHSFGRSAGRGRKKNVHSLLFKNTNYGIDRCGLSGTRSSHDHHDTILNCLEYCPFLHLIQLNILSMFYASDLFLQILFFDRKVKI